MTKPIHQARGEKPARNTSTSADLLGANSEIARKLKQYHDELLSLEVPDRFGELLGKLEHAERAKQAEATDSKAED
jgi:Anti-sigma factor NepR